MVQMHAPTLWAGPSAAWEQKFYVEFEDLKFRFSDIFFLTFPPDIGPNLRSQLIGGRIVGRENVSIYLNF